MIDIDFTYGNFCKTQLRDESDLDQDSKIYKIEKTFLEVAGVFKTLKFLESLPSATWITGKSSSTTGCCSGLRLLVKQHSNHKEGLDALHSNLDSDRSCIPSTRTWYVAFLLQSKLTWSTASSWPPLLWGKRPLQRWRNVQKTWNGRCIRATSWPPTF